MMWKGRYVKIEVPDNAYKWLGHREEIHNKAEELEELIHSIVTGAIERWQ